MEKSRYFGELAVLLIFVGLIGFLIIAGPIFTGYAVFEGGKKISIVVENSYSPGDKVNLGVILYDETNKRINGKIEYIVQDYYTDIIEKGTLESGEEVSFILPADSVQGLWKITATTEDAKGEVLFNVRELERADIILEGNKLIITNLGNVPYNKPISISIGEHSETALVPLGIGQTKEISLTAPEGVYDIRVSDGTDQNTFEVQGVSLTGNVIGIDKVVSDNFLSRFPLVTLFLAALILVFVLVTFLRIKKNK
jgi:hypothetical protein